VVARYLLNTNESHIINKRKENAIMASIIGIGLAAGSGIRIRPLTLKAPGYLRSKAAISLLGRRLMDWIIDLLKSQGLDEYIMVTKGKENRYQIKTIVGYGESNGVSIKYSPVSLDAANTGSGDALLSNLNFFDIDNTVVVFATDTIFDIDLKGMIKHHNETGAVATIAAALFTPEEIAGRYGMMTVDDKGRVTGFIEKPPLDEIHRIYGATIVDKLPTNAGFYIFNGRVLRELINHIEIAEKRKKQFDIGGDLLPWLVTNGYHVETFAISRMGDLGNIPSYLETMLDVLHGRFYSVNPCLNSQYEECQGMLIDPITMNLTDPISRMTLKEKIERGVVTIKAPVRIGKYVRIYPGAILSECNIDDDVEIFEHVTIRRATIGAGSQIKAGAVIEDALLGWMVEVESTLERPVRITGVVALGDEVVVRAGVHLRDHITIHPRIKVPYGIKIPPNSDIENIAQLHELL
jgi:NDP-sugar pyrophosphorylase family protein